MQLYLNYPPGDYTEKNILIPLPLAPKETE